MMLTIGVSPGRACSISSFTDEFNTPAKRPRTQHESETPASSVATGSITSTTNTNESINTIFQEHMLDQTYKDEPYILNMVEKRQEEAEEDAVLVVQRQLGTAPYVYQKLPKELGIVIVYLAQGNINAM